MAKKENRGGILTNEQIEQELERTSSDTRGYKGMQDTGDETLRSEGTAVQQRDGSDEQDQTKDKKA
jgi:hypothetical protein